MLSNKKIFVCCIFFLAGFNTLSTAQKIEVSYKDYVVQPVVGRDSSFINFLSSYKDSISRSMNEVIGFSLHGLYKHQPESALGNFMADAMKEAAEKVFATKVDVAFINYGGIRSYLPKGDITKGRLYELMPFDNLIVLQQMKGGILLRFLHHIAEEGGWPAAGLTMTINKDKQAVYVMINGKPLDEEQTYTVANVDYIANGGSNCSMLKAIPQLSKGYLLRDALIEHVIAFTKQGKSIDAQIQYRMIYGN